MMLLDKKHWVIFPVALFAAFFVLLPHAQFRTALGDAYQGIPRFVDDDAWYYLARARDVADGHATLGNPYLAEHKEKPAFQFFIPDWIEVQALKVFGTDVPTGFLILIPFFAFLNAVLMYGAVFALSRSRLAGVLASAFLFLGLFVKTFNRPTSPSFTILFWFLEFYALFAFVRSERKTWKVYLVNILALGMLFHVYPYYWSFYVTVIGTIFLCSTVVSFTKITLEQGTIFRRIWRSIVYNGTLNFKDICVVFGGAGIIAIPYFVAFWQAAHLPEYGETLTRFGVLSSHFPAGIRIVIPGFLLVVFCIALLWRKIISFTSKTIFTLGGLLGSVIVTNQHVITGKHFEPSLHYVDIGIVFAVAAFAYLAVSLARAIPKTSRLLAIAGACVTGGMVWTALSGNVRAFRDAYEWERELQRGHAVMSWLDGHIRRDEVVYADQNLSLLIPVYTSGNVLYNRNANLFFISNEENQARFLLNSYFDPVDEDFIRANERSLFGVRYLDADGHARQQNKIRNLLGVDPKPLGGIPRKEIEQVLEKFGELQRGDFAELLQKYHVKWLVWDSVQNPGWSAVERMPFLVEAAKIEGGFTIFRLK